MITIKMLALNEKLVSLTENQKILNLFGNSIGMPAIILEDPSSQGKVISYKVTDYPIPTQSSSGPKERAITCAEGSILLGALHTAGESTILMLEPEKTDRTKTGKVVIVGRDESVPEGYQYHSVSFKYGAQICVLYQQNLL